jgi:hypothetical protein
VWRCEGGREVHFLDHLIGQVQSALRRRAAVMAALWATAGVLAAESIILLADAVWDLCGSARLAVYLVTALSGAVTATIVAFVAWSRRPSDAYVARLIEKHRPALKNALITFVELRSAPGEDPSMGLAVGRRAVRILADDEVETFLAPFSVRRPAAATLVAAWILGMGLWLAQGVLFKPWVPAAEASVAQGGGQGPAATCLSGRQVQPLTPPDISATSSPTEAVTETPQPEEASPATGGDSDGDAEADGDPATRSSAPQSSAAPDVKGEASAGAAQALAAAIQAQRETLERLASALQAEGNSTQPAPNASAMRPAGAGDADQRDGGEENLPAGQAGPTRQNGGSDRSAAQTRMGPSAGLPENGSAASRPCSDRPEQGRRAEEQTTGGSGEAGAGQAPGAAAPTDPLQAGRRRDIAAMATSRGQTPADAAEKGTGAAGEWTPRDGGGGGGGDGSPTPRGQGAGEPPLPPRPQSEKFPPEVLDSMRQTKRLIEKAAERLRDGEVSDAFLDRMGMTPAEFRRFVVAWQRELESAPLGPAETAAPAVVRIEKGSDQGELLRPTGGAEARPMTGAVTAETDEQGGLVQGSEATVSPRFRRAISAYFETVSRLAADKPETKEPPK